MFKTLTSTRRKRILHHLLIQISAGFILLTIFVLLDPLSGLDREFSEEIQEHQNPFLDSFMRLISWFGYMPNVIYVVIFLSAFLLIFRKKREALFMALTLLSGVLTSLIKILVGRPRPLPDLVRVIEKTQQLSFPSGHVSFYIVCFGFLCWLMYQLSDIPKVLRIIIITFCLLLIFLIPISRIYLGAHWFTDVLGGFLLGLIILYLLTWFYMKGIQKKSLPDD